MVTYEFHLILAGQGDSEKEAWRDAVEAFMLDPGDPDHVVKLKSEEKDDPDFPVTHKADGWE